MKYSGKKIILSANIGKKKQKGTKLRQFPAAYAKMEVSLL